MALDLIFKDLAEVAAGSGSQGRPLKPALDRIDEDPDQPRREFLDEELQNLAASIRIEGILQPIVVRPSQQPGRFVIVMGARRYRAAKLAELAEAPVIVHDDGRSNPYAQMIENIQRGDLNASEIARFITVRLEAGEKQTEIARRLGKPRDWVSRYRAVPKMPSFLQEMLPTSSIRAVYKLYEAWRQEPLHVERAVKQDIIFTDAQAREFASTMRNAGSQGPAGSMLRSQRSRSRRLDLSIGRRGTRLLQLRRRSRARSHGSQRSYGCAPASGRASCFWMRARIQVRALLGPPSITMRSRMSEWMYSALRQSPSADIDGIVTALCHGVV